MAGDDSELHRSLAAKDPPEAEVFPPSTQSPCSGVVSKQLFGGDSGPGYWVEEDTANPLTIEFLEQFKLAPGPVIRLSPAALWFTPPAAERLPAREVRFYLKRGDWSVGPLRGKVVHLDSRSRRSCVGLKLIGVPLEAGRQIVAS